MRGLLVIVLPRSCLIHLYVAIASPGLNISRPGFILYIVGQYLSATAKMWQGPRKIARMTDVVATSASGSRRCVS
jgi:hypothetical protein